MIRFLIFLFCIISFNLHSQWEKTSGPLGSYLDDIEVVENEIIIGGINDVIYYSNDYGNNWENINQELLDFGYIQQLKLIDNDIFLLSSTGLFVTSDKGNNWIKNDYGFNSNYLTSLYYDDSLMILTEAISYMPDKKAGGIYISKDNGENWQEISSNENDISYFDAELYNNVLYIASSEGLLMSDNFGKDWYKPVSGIPNLRVNDIHTSNGYIFAAVKEGGFYFSIDYGKHWQESSAGLESYDVECITEDSGILYAGNAEGISKSEDYGLKWQPIGIDELPVTKYYDVAVENGIIYTSPNKFNLYKSNDNGNSWEILTKGMNNLSISEIESNDNGIYSSVRRGGIYKKSNNSNKWVQSNIGLSAYNIFNLSCAGSYVFGQSSYTPYLKSYHISVNANTWENIDNLYTTFVNEIFIINDILYVASYSGIYYTTDYKKNWEYLDTNYYYTRFYDVEDVGDYFICGTSDGIIKLEKNTVELTKLNEELLNGKDIRYVSKNDNVILAISKNNGSFYSMDNGFSWHIGNKKITDLNITALDSYENKFFISTLDSGIYTTIDNGIYWQNINENIKELSINDLDVIDKSLYLCTTRGIYKADINSFEYLGINPEKPVNNYLKIYPNPASDYIEITIANNRMVNHTVASGDIEIYDVLGNVVWKPNSVPSKTLHRSVSTTERIDISHLPSGVYFVRIGDKVEKFVKN